MKEEKTEEEETLDNVEKEDGSCLIYYIPRQDNECSCRAQERKSFRIALAIVNSISRYTCKL